MERLLTLSLRYRFFTLVVVILIMVAGLWSLTGLTIEWFATAVPVCVNVESLPERSPALVVDPTR